MEFYTTTVYISAYIGLFVVCFYLLSLRSYKKKERHYNYDNDKTVTIIIPAYNEQASIEKTIRSALAIDYPKDKFEIMVVDDGSKDDTCKLARKFVSFNNPRVRVFSKPNGGKGSALNYGIARCKSEIIISMDADTFVDPDAVKFLISRFYDKNVMSVTPSMGIYKPKTLWQRIQQIEYYLGTYLRKAFATMDSIHVTPGAFSAYRREFFLKHGGYKENILTEDMEIALRIQSHGYIIENVPEAIIHTLGPKTFKKLYIQRRRWYTGQIGNLISYRHLFGRSTGVLGTIVLPMAIISVFFSILLTSQMVIRVLNEIRKELLFLSSVNFEFNGMSEIGRFVTIEFFQKSLYKIFSSPLILLGIISLILIFFYLRYSKRKMKVQGFLGFNLVLFLIGFNLLRAFWWGVSLFYFVSNKEVNWR